MAKNLFFFSELANMGALLEAVTTQERMIASSVGCTADQKGEVLFTYDISSGVKDFLTGKQPEDIYYKLVSKMIREISVETGDNAVAGVLITCSLLKECLKLVTSGVDRVALQKEITACLDYLEKVFPEYIKPFAASDRDCLSRSMSDDQELCRCIGQAMDDVGVFGQIQYDVSNSFQSYYKCMEGSAFDRGFMSKEMTTDSMGVEAVLQNPLIVVTERPIVLTEDLLYFMQKAIMKKRPLLIIAEHVEDKPLQVLIYNKRKGQLLSAAVQAPKYGTERKIFLADIAAIVGAQVICAETGDLGLTVERDYEWQLGGADKVVLTKDKTMIIGGHGDPDEIKKRLAGVKRELKQEEDEKKARFLTDRVNLLSEKIGKIYVSGLAREAKAKKEQAERIVTAIRLAAEKGTVIGNMALYVHLAKRLEEEFKGIGYLKQSVCTALEAPLRAELEKRGLASSSWIARIKAMGPEAGFDFHTLACVENMREKGQIAAAEAVMVNLRKALSLAAMLVTTELAVAETGPVVEEEKRIRLIDQMR